MRRAFDPRRRVTHSTTTTAASGSCSQPVGGKQYEALSTPSERVTIYFADGAVHLAPDGVGAPVAVKVAA
jgi:hypothetical protein